MDAIRTYHTGVSQDALLRQPELKELRKSLLLGAHDFYLRLKENLEGRRSNDPATRLKLAQACLDLGRLATQIGSMKDARASYEQALALHRGLADEYPEHNAYQRDLANTYNAMGDLDIKTGRYDDAETAFRTGAANSRGIGAPAPGRMISTGTTSPARTASWAPFII